MFITWWKIVACWFEQVHDLIFYRCVSQCLLVLQQNIKVFVLKIMAIFSCSLAWTKTDLQSSSCQLKTQWNAGNYWSEKRWAAVSCGAKEKDCYTAWLNWSRRREESSEWRWPEFFDGGFELYLYGRYAPLQISTFNWICCATGHTSLTQSQLDFTILESSCARLLLAFQCWVKICSGYLPSR